MRKYDDLDITHQSMAESERSGQVIIEWVDAAHTILRMALIGEWRFQDVFWGLVQMASRMSSSKHKRVDVIYDLEQTGKFPQALNSAMRLEFLWRSSWWPPTSQRIIIVGTSPELLRLRDLRATIAPETMSYFHWVATLADAEALLAQWRAADTAD